MLKKFEGELPDVGGMVVYHDPGRALRDRFPAMVLKSYPDGELDLLIFRGLDDVVQQSKVPPHSNQNKRGWAQPGGTGGLSALQTTVATLAETLQSLAERVNAVSGEKPKRGRPATAKTAGARKG